MGNGGFVVASIHKGSSLRDADFVPADCGWIGDRLWDRPSPPFGSLESGLRRESASTDLALRLGVHHLPLLGEPIKLGSHRLIL